MSKKVMNDAEMQKVTTSTAKKLAAQPKEKIKIYLSPEERQKLESNPKLPWPFETVQINGHTFQIQKGKEVEVPKSVANVLRQANRI